MSFQRYFDAESVASSKMLVTEQAKLRAELVRHRIKHEVFIDADVDNGNVHIVMA